VSDFVAGGEFDNAIHVTVYAMNPVIQLCLNFNSIKEYNSSIRNGGGCCEDSVGLFGLAADELGNTVRAS